MKAMVLTFRWIFENRDATVEFLSKEMQLKPVHARKGWEFYTQNRFWPPDGDVTMEGMKNNIRIYAEQTGVEAGVAEATGGRNAATTITCADPRAARIRPM